MIAKKVYGASTVIYSEKVKEQIEFIKLLGKDKLPICIAKTQYSFSDDPKNLECEKPFSINISEIKLNAGARIYCSVCWKYYDNARASKHSGSRANWFR